MKPVRMVVPLAPGGGSDIVGRIVAQALAEQWRQSVVVDNRPGAGGTIGNAIVAKALPDGYTLLVSSSTLAIGPALYKSTTSDVAKDFDAVSLLADQPSIMAVHAHVPVKTMADLIALFKAQPGKYSFGSAGAGTASHLANELNPGAFCRPGSRCAIYRAGGIRRLSQSRDSQMEPGRQGCRPAG